MPDWYLLLRAARYLGVPPWQLVDVGSMWMKLALESERVEGLAEQKRMKRSPRQRRRMSGG